MLASHFVDTPDGREREALLAVCRRHLDGDGVLAAECYPPGYDWEGVVGQTRRIGSVEITVTAAGVDGGRVEATVEYAVDRERWRQSFAAAVLDEPQLHASLAAARLPFERWLDRERGWFTARATE